MPHISLLKHRVVYKERKKEKKRKKKERTSNSRSTILQSTQPKQMNELTDCLLKHAYLINN